MSESSIVNHQSKKKLIDCFTLNANRCKHTKGEENEIKQNKKKAVKSRYKFNANNNREIDAHKIHLNWKNVFLGKERQSDKLLSTIKIEELNVLQFIYFLAYRHIATTMKKRKKKSTRIKKTHQPTKKRSHRVNEFWSKVE